MNLAPRAALLAGLVALSGVFLTVRLGGPLTTTAAAILGFALFGAGVFYGHGPVTAGGLALVALAVAVATEPTVGGTVLVIVLGVVASATLVLADASWWLRREPQVEAAVVRGLTRTLVPVWILGAGLGAGATAVARLDGYGIWFLPAGVLAAAGLVSLVVRATRRRHPRRDPLADLRR